MKLEQLIQDVFARINVNLRELALDVEPYFQYLDADKLAGFYAFYGISPQHPLNLHFNVSNLAGSFFLGKCAVDHAVVYKSDIRGDELKRKGEVIKHDHYTITMLHDEAIRIRYSLMIKTLVHNFSHDPENPEEFLIQNTVSTYFANIHGSSTEGCFIQPFATIDLTTAHDSLIGSFAYVQVGEMDHLNIKPGMIWVRGDAFEFKYCYPQQVLDQYIFFEPGQRPGGLLMDFIDDRKTDFQDVFEVVMRKDPIPIPEGAALDRYAVVKGNTKISKNVLVAQRAYLENAQLGPGANAQENCYIIDAVLEGYNVSAHGAKIIHAHLGEKVFTGFNSFLNGKQEAHLKIGANSIVMPHTIIDLDEPVTIPSESLVWGHIKNKKDLETHSLSLEALAKINQEITLGDMHFKGSGAAFIKAFQERIEHILEANGAYYDGNDADKGHAQKNRKIAFNTIQSYQEGELKGLCPTIIIRP